MRHDFPLTLIEKLRSAKKVVIFTGAGVSAESGIATFRDALIGLWVNFNAEDLATPVAFKRDPELVWGWYEWRRMRVLQAQPNPAHLTIARLATHYPALTVVTQNVDDLHERAGSREVIHLHGSLHYPRCYACHRPHALPPGIPDEPEGGRRLTPPTCQHCGGRVRPGVVWFGEELPESAWRTAKWAAKDCDLFFSVGTSALVFPANTLPLLVDKSRACVVQVNPQPTELNKVARYNLTGKAGDIMPALYRAAYGDDCENGGMQP